MITEWLRSHSDCMLFEEGKVEHINGPSHPFPSFTQMLSIKGGRWISVRMCIPLCVWHAQI